MDQLLPNPRPITFALTPAIAHNTVIDYKTREGQKLYQQATDGFMVNSLFDVDPAGLATFINNATEHCMVMNFVNGQDSGIMNIPNNPVNPTKFTNLLQQHGEVTWDTIKIHERSYINSPNRPAQDTHNFYKSIMRSLSTEGKAKITVWKDMYIIDGKQSGVALFKIVVRESHLDTHATVTTIRTQLSTLDTYVHTIGCNILKLNQYVKQLVTNLQARGETTNNLLVNLFKAYLSTNDKEFVRYIHAKKDSYDEGNNTSPDELMNLASNKYKLLKQSGKWEAPDANEEKLIALQTEIQKLKYKARAIRTENGGDRKGKTGKEKTTWESRPDWLAKNIKPTLLKKSKNWRSKDYFGAPKRLVENVMGNGAFTNLQNARASVKAFTRAELEERQTLTKTRK